MVRGKKIPGSIKYTLVLFLISLSFFSNTAVKIERYFWGVKPGVTLEGLPMKGFLEDEVRNIVHTMAIDKAQLPRNANLVPGTGEIYPERIGTAVYEEKTVRLLMNAEENAKVRLQTTVVLPDFTSKDIESIKTELGRYRTYISGSAERAQNIRLATESINFTLLKPGEIFSFNRIVGPRTEKHGYKKAPVIVYEGHEMGYGGGVCQVASTLYNAVIGVKLKIVERHGHTKRVHYVPKNKDATVTYPYLDFRFQNNTGSPLIIRGESGGGVLVFWVMGK